MIEEIKNTTEYGFVKVKVDEDTALVLTLNKNNHQTYVNVVHHDNIEQLDHKTYLMYKYFVDLLFDSAERLLEP